jgi:dTDP-glucose pyrophosphorylase
MAGAGSRFAEIGYTQPKPLIQINGKPFFYWSALAALCAAPIRDITFVVLAGHVTEHQIDKTIRQYFPDAAIVIIPKLLPGPVMTSLKGIGRIDDELPVLVNDCDHIFGCTALRRELEENETLNFDGALLTFEAKAPQYSFVRYDVNGEIIGTAEKKVVSDRGICGAYFFGHAKLFCDLAGLRLAQDATGERHISELYNSELYNYFDGQMRIKEFPLDYHVNFGTPLEYANALDSTRFSELAESVGAADE